LIAVIPSLLSAAQPGLVLLEQLRRQLKIELDGSASLKGLRFRQVSEG